MNNETIFVLGVFIGGIIGIGCHACVTGALHKQQTNVVNSGYIKGEVRKGLANIISNANDDFSAEITNACNAGQLNK